ncbi:hypothetical protein HMPREF3156_02453 [Neisseria sp. HMSC06F02]|uniref:Uncharacterized protein n=1 Tax=Neisseria sicca VK64 TaxID=1095748 RepID=I2NFZ5_NEISI|nr:hypothetical protein HMPREF1051_1335 [Neisseria sicca VK64]KJJ12713.1 hypothetical protein HMPREF3156_02453 [Neisseria sp. HMSC06F02]
MSAGLSVLKQAKLKRTLRKRFFYKFYSNYCFYFIFIPPNFLSST